MDTVDHPKRQPTAINKLFDDKKVGRLGRQFAMKRESIIQAPAPHTPVAITPATAEFKTKY